MGDDHGALGVTMQVRTLGSAAEVVREGVETAAATMDAALATRSNDTALVKAAIKSQPVRLFDVFILGPMMIYAAARLPSRHWFVRPVLGISGALTIWYNGRNFLLNEKHRHAREQSSDGVLPAGRCVMPESPVTCP